MTHDSPPQGTLYADVTTQTHANVILCNYISYQSAHAGVNWCRKQRRYKFLHDHVIKWKHFPRYWPFVRGIHRSPVNSPHNGQWRGALMFSLIYVWINGWVNNCKAGDLRRHHAHYDVTVMCMKCWFKYVCIWGLFPIHVNGVNYCFKYAY